MITKLLFKRFCIQILDSNAQLKLAASGKIPLSTMIDENQRFVRLNNAVEMPILGLGTYKMQGEVVKKAVDCALRQGYRAIDSAAGYNNEKEIGSILKSILPELGLERKNIFITTKLPPSHHGSIKCESMFLSSLANLDLSYIDLYLIHWPGVSGHAIDDIALPKLRRETWLKMEELYSQGKIRAIGVSNYTVKHLEELFSYCTVKPTVNQVEYHPHLVQKELYEYCKSHDVHLQAYSSLGTSSSAELLTDNVVVEISKKYDKVPAQLLLKWAVEQQIGVIPKASNLEHVKSNFNLWDFSITADDMKRLNNLNQSKRYCWNPETVI